MNILPHEKATLEILKGILDAMEVSLNGIQGRLEMELEAVAKMRTMILTAHDSIGALLDGQRVPEREIPRCRELGI